MGYITYVFCLPVRALLYVLLKPPLLVYALIKYCVLSIVSVPAYYLGRLADRVKMLWNWTHRLSLPWWSRPCTAKATQTLDDREEVLDLSAVPHISPSLGLEPGHARRDLALARRRRPPIWRQQLSEEAKRLGQSQVELSRREALASLITLLLQPMSPPDSDSEEEEKPMTAAYMEEEEETKRALQLILDLVRISKSHTDASSPSEASMASLQQAADVTAMRRHARDCEKLQNLISELDRLAVEVDPASLLHRRRPRRREDRRERSRSRSPCHPFSPSTEEGQVSSEGTTEYQEANTSLDTDTDQFTEANEGSSPDLQEGEGEEESDILDQAARMESQRSTHTYPTQLSPVQESPEYSRRSTSVESISHLESDLNTALSRLDTETSDLRVDEDVLASFESQMGRERPNIPATTHSQAGGNTSLSSLHSTIGSVSTEGDATVWSTSLSPSEDVFEDCSEDFATIPATPPSLGLKEGHDRRDLAVARSSSKRRPPTRRSTTNPEQTSEVVSDKQSEGEIVEEEEEEMDESENKKLDFVPTLTDQIHLLKPGFPMPSDPDTESESTLPTFSNLTEPEITPAPTHGQASEKETTPAPTHGQASEKDVSVESRRQGSAEPESKAAQEPSLHIPSSEPPWIEMRRKSKDTQPPPVPPSLEKSPKIPMLEPDEKDSEDSIYDTLEPLETPSHEAMYETLPFTKYLHQTIAEQQQQKQESPHPSPSPHHSTSPQLPPRNPTHKVPVVEEREGRSRHRHSSRHHSSSPSERPSASSKEKDKHGSESSRKHRSHSSDRERHSSSSRRSSSDKHSTDKHSSSHSRSREHSSSHSERHSDKHRSHSSEKHSHGSSKSRESDGKKKASNPAKVKDNPKEEGKKHSSSSSRDTSKSKSESSRSKSDSSKSKSESSKSSKSESSKSSKSKSAEKTPEKSSKSSSRASSLKASSTPTDEKALMKSTSLTSLNSVRSQGGSSLVLESGKETEV